MVAGSAVRRLVLCTMPSASLNLNMNGASQSAKLSVTPSSFRCIGAKSHTPSFLATFDAGCGVYTCMLKVSLQQAESLPMLPGPVIFGI